MRRQECEANETKREKRKLEITTTTTTRQEQNEIKEEEKKINDNKYNRLLKKRNT